jgi:hypothetical protein
MNAWQAKKNPRRLTGIRFGYPEKPKASILH